jgi:hypothetical protein
MITFSQLLETVKSLYPIDILLEATNDFDPARQQRGLQAEQDFAMSLKNHGYYMKEADRKQEREYHIDFLVYNDPERSIPSWQDRPENGGAENSNTVEVKQKNKIVDGNVLVEFVAKDQYAGWLCSHANYLAYEYDGNGKQEFILIKMDNLRNYVNSLIQKRGLDEFPTFEAGLDPEKENGRKIFNAINKYVKEGKLQFVDHFTKAVFPKVYYREFIQNNRGETRADGSVITFIPFKEVLNIRNTKLIFETKRVNPEFRIVRIKFSDTMRDLVQTIKSLYGSDDNESKQYVLDKIKGNDVNGLVEELGDAAKDNEALSPENINKLVQFYKQNSSHNTFK